MGLGGAIAGGAAISGIAGLGGSLISGNAAQRAAGTAADAQRLAALMQQQEFQLSRNDLQPYNVAGQGVLGALSDYYKTSQADLGTAADRALANIPHDMTQSDLVKTPGYQFSLDQGLKALQNSQAGKGLGMSGAGMKAATNFGTGLANSTYKDQFNIQQQKYQDYVQDVSNRLGINAQVFQQLFNTATLGENAAARSGSLGVQSFQNIGNMIAGAGASQAAGTAAFGGALGSGLSNFGNSVGNGLMGYYMAPYLQNALGGGGGTGAFADFLKNQGGAPGFAGAFKQEGGY